MTIFVFVLYCIVLYCILLFCICIVFVLYLYCICIVFVLYLYCICIVFVLYCIVLYCIVLYCIVLYCIFFNFIVFYCIALYCINICILFYCIVLFFIVLYCIVLMFSLYCIVLYYIVFYCIVMHKYFYFYCIVFYLCFLIQLNEWLESILKDHLSSGPSSSIIGSSSPIQSPTELTFLPPLTTKEGLLSGNFCRELVCRDANSSVCRHRTQQELFDGTPCGRRKECVAGKCLPSKQAPSKGESHNFSFVDIS